MEPVIGILVMVAVFALAFVYSGYRESGAARRTEILRLKDDLASANHLVMQVKARPTPCAAHSFPREPELRKPGFYRYACVTCGEKRWVRVGSTA